MKKTYLLLFGALLSAGSYAAPWAELGEQDGQNGKMMQNIAAQSDSSASATREYIKGYQRGLNQFCQPQQARKLGLEGESYKGICMYSDNGWEFEQAYQKAFAEYKKSHKREEWLKLSRKSWY